MALVDESYQVLFLPLDLSNLFYQILYFNSTSNGSYYPTRDCTVEVGHGGNNKPTLNVNKQITEHLLKYTEQKFVMSERFLLIHSSEIVVPLE